MHTSQLETTRDNATGFTLIELSIVIVIIGLIAGGVLVGRDLIGAAQVRSQITQIEEYTTAFYTFKAKYNCLPGDCKNAAQYGFVARGAGSGQGDGNGYIMSSASAGYAQRGEPGVFWRDLSEARLIKENLNTMTMTVDLSLIPIARVLQYYPEAKIAKGNIVYMYSSGGAPFGPWIADGKMYFSFSKIRAFYTNYNGIISDPGLTTAQAYAIDSKVDDGLPQQGKVIAKYLCYSMVWSHGDMDCANDNYAFGTNDNQGIPNGGGPSTNATAPTAKTCYDNNNTGGAEQHYTLGQGDDTNCSISMQF